MKQKDRRVKFLQEIRMALKLLSALDTARTQLNYFKAIIIEAIGLLTDA